MAHTKVLFKMNKQHNQYKANKNKKIKCLCKSHKGKFKWHKK